MFLYIYIDIYPALARDVLDAMGKPLQGLGVSSRDRGSIPICLRIGESSPTLAETLFVNRHRWGTLQKSINL